MELFFLMLHTQLAQVTASSSHQAPVGRKECLMSETDDGYRKSLLTLLRLVRRPMSVKELSQACCLGEGKVRTLMAALVDDLEVRAVQQGEAGQEAFCATPFSPRSRQ